MSSKTMMVASGVVCAMLTIASVITRASSFFWASVRPVHISILTIGMGVLLRRQTAIANQSNSNRAIRQANSNLRSIIVEKRHRFVDGLGKAALAFAQSYGDASLLQVREDNL